MASAVDIPRQLLTSERRHDFVNWCRFLPVEASVKRALLRAWEDVTGARLTAADRRAIHSTMSSPEINGAV